MEATKPVVLLAEDEEIVRQYLALVLERNGYTVLQAIDGDEAIRLYEAEGERLTAIVSDMAMPGADGAALAKYNYENRYLPFVACTGIMDAKKALTLLGWGVKDYVVKPVQPENFIAIVANSVLRRNLETHFEDDSNPYAGNMGSITVPSRLAEVARVIQWVQSKVKMPEAEYVRFSAFLREFLLNAHEHGNLRLSEADKTRLINEGKLLETIKEKEAASSAKIQVDLSVLANEVAVCITDNGFGFNWKKYVAMAEDELLERLEMPNGRGIYMAAQYFDSISYSKGGASVLLTKKFSPV